MTSRQEPPRDFPEPSAEPLPAREFVAHYQAVYPRLAALAAGVLGCREGAEDIVQQAVEIALAKGQQFDSASRFVHWMAGTVRRCALNQRRKNARRRTHATNPVDLATAVYASSTTDLPIDPATGEIHGQQQSFEDRLLAALERLSVDARCCLLLRTVQELSYAEIAQLLDIPEGTAMSHVHRSRRLLRTQLSQAAPDDPKRPTSER